MGDGRERPPHEERRSKGIGHRVGFWLGLAAFAIVLLFVDLVPGLAEDEARFIDISRSRLFMTEEQEIF